MQGILIIAYIALAIVQLVAFMEGLDSWLGFGTVVSIIAFVIAMMLGPVGGIAIAVIGFMGATEGWGWEWWQAAVLCFPFAILGFFAMAADGVLSLLHRN